MRALKTIKNINFKINLIVENLNFKQFKLSPFIFYNPPHTHTCIYEKIYRDFDLNFFIV